MSQKMQTAITPTRQEDYPQWYQQVIKHAELSELSPVRGCMIIKPWGYALWENIQRHLDQMFKDTGHVNAYFPLFIPLSYLEKEAEHVEGFAKECAVVTHHRLEADGKGGLKPAGALEEPLVVRPTSEMIIGEAYARWVQSYRDLPVLINQWANVVRWEMRTRQFLRTSEFLWQEGHTAHATADEAREETAKMHEVYRSFARDYMALPVVMGEKVAYERFPGAVDTFTIEAMMQDRKALQAGTSHFLGQNFAKALGIQFLNKAGEQEHAWTTSWGVSTRLVGGMVMAHSDDDGLVLPPRLAPVHIVILPIYRKDAEREAVLSYCRELEQQLKAQRYAHEAVRVSIDDRDIRGGEKTWQHIKKGVPVRVEIGPRDMAAQKVCVTRRDRGPKQKDFMEREVFLAQVADILAEIQSNIYERALAFQEQHSAHFDDLEQLIAYFQPQTERATEIHGGFAYVHLSEEPEVQAFLKQHKLTHRCYPLEQEREAGRCLVTGKGVDKRSLIARAY